jgi:hydroxymethylbilane synthase
VKSRAPTTRPIRIGTRGSALARVQAATVEKALRHSGATATEIVTVETAGDRRRPDTSWGEGAFVAAIEDALLDGLVDVAVHSAKDIPTSLNPGAVISAFLPREDPRDALVVRADATGRTLVTLPPGSRVGTDSPRRTAFVRAARPDLVVHPLHGNVDTRLRRLDAGETDALVLAVAGLSRLGRADRIAELLDPFDVPPAPGQGAIAIQVRADDSDTLSATAAVDDPSTRLAVEAERTFLAASGGGCRAPIGALATIEDGELVLLGGYARPDGSVIARDRIRGSLDDAARLARALAGRLGERLPGIAEPLMRSDAPRVLVTRSAAAGGVLARRLAEVGLEAVLVPTIAVEEVEPGGALDAAAARFGSYDWVVVTSVNGARAALAAANRVRATLGAPRWAAVGLATRRVLEEGGVGSIFQPGTSSAAGLAAIPLEPGDHVLLVRGNLGGTGLPGALRGRGAEVDEVVAYETREAPEPSRPLLRDAVRAGPIAAVLFTSGSTVRGLRGLLTAESLELPNVPAICIGPETSAAARWAGFQVLAEAPQADARTLAATAARALAERPRRSDDG